MTILTTIPNGASGKDVRDTINYLLSTVAALTGSTPLTISGTPGSATQGSAYSFTPTTSGGSGGTKTFSLTGTLPAGLSFSTTTGRITGTPTAVGTTSGLNITVTDGAYTVSLGTFSLVVAAVAATLQALTVSNGTGTIGSAISSTITGLTSGSSVALTGAGAAGLSISGAVITGTPTTAGAVNIVETLAGASNSPRTTSSVITVAAAAAVPGLHATSFPIAPSMQYHAADSATTIASDGTFQGYMAAGSDKLTVTSLAVASCPFMREGQEVVATGLPAGTVVLKMWTASGGTPGNGVTGDYKLSAPATTAIGSSGSPATFTAKSRRVSNIADLKAYADMSTNLPYNGPELMTDAEGNKFLRFTGGPSGRSFVDWMRNITLTGIDASNLSCLLVARMFCESKEALPLTITNKVVSLGAKELNNEDANYNQVLYFQNGHALPANAYGTDPAYNKLFYGSQKALYARVTVTDDGVGGTNSSPSIRATRHYVNQNYVDIGTNGSSATRLSNTTGFSFNSAANATGGGGMTMDVYEVAFFLKGEFGTRAQMPARADAAMAAMCSNHGIVPITKNLTVLGDSRTAYGLGVSFTNYLTEGSGVNLHRLMTDPGSALAVPKNVRVMTYAFAGLGIDGVNAIMDSDGTGNTFNQACPLAPARMLGGGNDYFTALMGSNDYGNWPNNTWGGVAAVDTVAFGDDLYGSSYTATMNVTNSGKNFTVNSSSGPLAQGSTIPTSAGLGNGLGAFAVVPGKTTTPTAFQTMNVPTSNVTNTATTAILKGYKLVAQALIARGFKGHWFCETYSGASRGVVGDTMSAHILNDMVPDTLSGSGQTYAGSLTVSDPTLLTVNGTRPFGPDWQGASGLYYNDLIHWSNLGRRTLFSGGDTPTLGIGYATKQLLSR